MPQVEVPSRYRIPTKGEARIEVHGDTVRHCIEAVEVRYPGFQELILDPKGDLRRFVRLLVNDDVIARDALDAPISGDDCIAILVAAAGG